jgi:hypothetical protein
MSRFVALVAAWLTLNTWNLAFGQWPPVVTYPEALNGNASLDTGRDTWATLVTDTHGVWLVTWTSNDDLGGTIGTDWDCLFARSTDNGATWSYPRPLNTNAATDSGDDTSCALTTDGQGNWVAVWMSNDDLNGTVGTDLDILFSRSTDNGINWTAPLALNSTAYSDTVEGEGDPAITTDGHGTWVAAYSSSNDLGGTIGQDWDILFSRSFDNGATWTDPLPLNGNAASYGGSDWGVRLTNDGQGTWVAVWGTDDTLGGTIGTDQDILFSRSTDNGSTWTYPQPLNTNAGVDTGGDGGAWVAMDGRGNCVAVWGSFDDLGGTIGTDQDILFSRSTDNCGTWTAPAPLNAHAPFDMDDDGGPVVATDATGTWIAVWYSNHDLGGTIGSDNDILVSRSTDNGATWTSPAALNANAALDSGSDAYPRVGTDGRGNWVTVWRSTDDLGGTIGTDEDILVARFHITPIPTISEWGTVVMSLLLLTAGTVVVQSKRMHMRLDA